MLRLGVIGLSDGNGHPYSWSAIFNGYDPDHMKNCGFPVIPEYLGRQSFPADAIAQGRVTHVWTQDRAISEHIAKAARIEHVVDDPTAMIGAVDAILLARDDAVTHLPLARPFLEAGLPVYIDKPLALSETEARVLFGLEQWRGQLFTCSALRYAQEFSLSEEERQALGAIRHVSGIIPKYWDTYAVHIVEPALALIRPQGDICQSTARRVGDGTVLELCWETGVTATFTTAGSMPVSALTLRIEAEHGSRDLTFRDTFPAFKGALQAFVDGVLARQPQIPMEATLDVVRVIEAGRRI